MTVGRVVCNFRASKFYKITRRLQNKPKQDNRLVIVLVLILRFLVIEQCSNFGVCSATCGDGTQTCSNNCLNGNFGDDGCPTDQEVKTKSCNLGICPGKFEV